MQETAGSPSARVLEFLRDACVRSTDVAGFAAAGLEGLPRLVASELTTLSICDLARGRRTVFSAPVPSLGSSELETFDRFFYEHPLVRFHSQHADGGACRISDAVATGEFRRSPLFNEYYRRLGIDHVMAMPLFVDRRFLISFVANRSGRDFGDGDRGVFDAVRVQLAALFRHALLLERARAAMTRIEELSVQEGWCVICIDGAGRVRRISDRARERVALCCPGEPLAVDGRLPAALDRWVVESLADVYDVLSRNATASLTLAHAGTSLRFHLVPDADATDGYLVLVGRPARGGPLEPAQDLPVTAREREVLTWAAAGKTNQQIAEILGTSTRTVEKHFEHIFDKLGVETRTAAVMRALRAPGADERR